MKTATATQYYYRLPSGAVSGPLPLDAIRTAVKVSRLPVDTLVSETQGEPWLDLELLPPGVAERRREIAAAYNPNLRNCPACGKEIARDAPACPNCGKRFATPVGLIIAVIIGVAIGLILIFPTLAQIAGE
jgi:hypothetical protein